MAESCRLSPFFEDLLPYSVARNGPICVRPTVKSAWMAIVLVTVDVHNTFPLNIEDMIENGEFKTLRPIIGIVSMPIRGANILENLNTAQNESHIAASFVKLVEGAGGRVVPLVETFNDTMIKMLLKSINGVLLPGGSDALIRSNYRRISALAYEYSISMYKKGITWPVFGICRGFQMLMALEMNEEKPTIASTDAMNLTLSLEFTKEAEKSRLFGNASSGIMEILEKERVTFNAHNNGITTKLFEKHTELQEAWRVLSTNRDRNGKEFISTFEGINFPVYGIQWHPEKPLYVWNPVLDINHSVHSIMVSQYMANFFVCEARKNSNRFPSRAEEEKYLIYQFKTHYVGNIEECAYEQIYMWKLY